MRYTDDEFIKLLEEVEAQGGRHNPDRCGPRVYETTGDLIKPVKYANCGVESLLDVAYDPTAEVTFEAPVMERDPKRPQGTRAKTIRTMTGNGEYVDEIVTHTVTVGAAKDTAEKRIITVCAFEDNVGLWPRFAGSIEHGN